MTSNIFAVKFYPNTPDNTHCFQAVIRMVLKYFLPDQEFSYQKLDKLSNKVEDKWTWAPHAFIYLKKMGFELINISSFDWQEFADKGEIYLKKIWGIEVAKRQAQMSDIIKEQQEAQEFVSQVKYEVREPSIKDIEELLQSGYLVGCNINSALLNNQPGFDGHSILVIGIHEDNVHFHDPGLPALENRVVTKAEFNSAWASPNVQAKSLTGFKL